jgi:ATP-dependent RNA helicase RhlE
LWQKSLTCGFLRFDMEIPESEVVEALASFEDFALNRQLLNAVADLGWQVPSPVQRKAIPIALAGSDVMGIAQTGTGKTGAYLLPLLMKIKYAQGTAPRALIFAPTRELVLQIGEEARKLAAYTDLRIVCLYGGLGPKTQIEEIGKGVDLVVATPGRFLDLYLQNLLSLKEIKTMVLDEADKMMDMGFMPQVRRILEVVPRKRQNLLFSATMPDKVVRLSEEFLEFPIRVELSPQATAAQTVEQVIYQVPNFKTKINLVGHLLQDPEINRVIIFARTKGNADNVSKFIERKVDRSVRVIHANKGQNTRINAMNLFKEGDLRVLVATDVAARGIDVSMVSHVINFDVPIIYEDYVHRIGRTGRANNLGKAITFCTKDEVYHLAKIEKIIRQTIPVREIPAEVAIEETPFEEEQTMLREIDQQRRREDPTFQGAFHEKKKKPQSNKNPKSTTRTRKK